MKSDMLAITKITALRLLEAEDRDQMICVNPKGEFKVIAAEDYVAKAIMIPPGLLVNEDKLQSLGFFTKAPWMTGGILWIGLNSGYPLPDGHQGETIGMVNHVQPVNALANLSFPHHDPFSYHAIKTTVECVRSTSESHALFRVRGPVPNVIHWTMPAPAADGKASHYAIHPVGGMPSMDEDHHCIIVIVYRPWLGRVHHDIVYHPMTNGAMDWLRDARDPTDAEVLTFN